MKTMLLGFAVAGVLALGANSALAGVSVSVRIGGVGIAVAAPPPVYVHTPPVRCAPPPPVWCAPQPYYVPRPMVYVRPVPVVVMPRPFVGYHAGTVHRSPGHPGHHHGHGYRW